MKTPTFKRVGWPKETRPVIVGKYVLEVFNNAVEVTYFMRKLFDYTGQRGRSWKQFTGKHAGKYCVEYWLGPASGQTTIEVLE